MPKCVSMRRMDSNAVRSSDRDRTPSLLRSRATNCSSTLFANASASLTKSRTVVPSIITTPILCSLTFPLKISSPLCDRELFNTRFYKVFYKILFIIANSILLYIVFINSIL
ncbi:hypothetical protein V8G54_024606 [Vigna mungo]|uniref:Uncharacterized protein n=1 Tax=Vigna mungo TaxID=3915 RepID=A0AAQ3N6P7_VIGMU